MNSATTTAKAQHKVEGRLLLDVVVRESAAVLELLASEDQALLVWRDALLVLDLGLDVLDRVRWLNLERDGLARQGLDEDLHATAQAKHEVEGRLLLDVVVRESAAVLELLASEDQALLIWRNTYKRVSTKVYVSTRVTCILLFIHTYIHTHTHTQRFTQGKATTYPPCPGSWP